MDYILKGWTIKLLYSLIPAGVSVVTAFFGNPVLQALGEGYSTFLYLVVLLSLEVVVLSVSQTEEVSSVDILSNAMPLLIVTIIWILFLWARVITANGPNGQVPWLLYGVSAVGIVSSYFIIRNHLEFTQLQNISRDVRRNEKKQIAKLEKKGPARVRIRGKSVDV